MAIASLLDGRHFYIPAYQRGYRWTKKQVEDLLKDLYTFALKRNKKEGEFYCLQPLIVQRVTDRQIIDECTCEGAGNKEVWELIDGQQRLTSIFILYKYLLEQRGWDKARLKEMVGKELYHLYFETRKDSKEFLENLDSTHLDGNDIDANHICEAYRIIDRWITDEAPLLSKRYERSSYKESVQNVLFSLLNCNKEDVHESNGSVQVIWYELEADVNQNPIKEFLRINNGKIKLTNAELIKALFLQKRNFEGGEKEIKQIEIALQWENIENTLHKDDFWYYLNGRGKNLPNRIDFLLGLLYKVENLNTDKRIDERLKELNTRLKEDEDTVFRFYNEKFEGLQGVDLQQVIKAEWHKITKVSHLL